MDTTELDDIIHRLSNAFATIVGTADLLASDPDLPEQNAADIAELVTASDDATLLLDRLRAYRDTLHARD